MNANCHNPKHSLLLKYAPVFVAAILLFVGLLLVRQAFTPLYVDVSAAATPPSTFQLFWSKNSKIFSERQSGTCLLHQELSLCTIRVSKAASSLRIDPRQTAGSARLQGLTVRYGMFKFPIPVDAIKAAISKDSSLAAVSVEDSVDITAYREDPKFAVPVPARIASVRKILIGCGWAIIAAALAIVCAYHLRTYDFARAAYRGTIAAFNARSNSFLERAFQNSALIHCSRGLQLLAIASIVCFITLVACKVSGSSVGVWDLVVPQANSQAPILGDPRGIRSDEWLVYTPSILSQYTSPTPFPAGNPAWGAGANSLVQGRPVHHESSFFRPIHWGFFIFDFERGFAFYWWFKCFALLWGLLLVLMLVSGSFWLSLAGSLWFFFSSHTQWWLSSWFVDHTAAGLWALIGIIYLSAGTKRWMIWLSCVPIILGAVSYATLLYPPSQISLAYVLSALFATYLCTRRPWQELRAYRLHKVWALALSGAVITYAVGRFALDIQATIPLVVDTKYPGQRMSIPGEVPLFKFLSGFFDSWYRDGHFPEKLSNVCEAANFHPLFLLPLFAWALSWRRLPRIDWTLLPLVLVSVFLLCWIVVPLPSTFGTWTLLSRAPGRRCLNALGLAGISLCVLFMSRPTVNSMRASKRAILYGVLLVALGALIHYINNELNSFVSIGHEALVLGYGALLCFAVLEKRRVLFGGLIVLIPMINFATVNPIQVGMAPLISKDLFRLASNVQKQDPTSRWIVYGDRMPAEMIKATGAYVLNGVKFPPELQVLRQLFPEPQAEIVYNRFAHILVADGPEQPESVPLTHEVYKIRVSPCSQALRSLKIDYFVFSYPPSAETTTCLRPLTNGPVNRKYWIYQRPPS